MAQGSNGIICAYTDLTGDESPVALTTAGFRTLSGGWMLIGDGLAEIDSGLVGQAADNGVARLTTTNEADHAAYLATGVNYRPSTNGTLFLEARVALPALTARRVFVGISDGAAAAETNILTGSGATLTKTKSDYAGFFFDSGLTSGAWHAVYNGGSTTGPTVSGEVVTSISPVAAAFNILRLEVYPGGRVRFTIDGEQVSEVEGAVLPTVRQAALVGVAATTTTIATLDVDCAEVNYHRNWS